jgi:hypothetical protein
MFHVKHCREGSFLMPAFYENKINGGEQPDGQNQRNELFEVDQQEKGTKNDQADHRERRNFFY